MYIINHSKFSFLTNVNGKRILAQIKGAFSSTRCKNGAQKGAQNGAQKGAKIDPKWDPNRAQMGPNWSKMGHSFTPGLHTTVF